MSQCTRQTFINSINRNYHFTKSGAFKERDKEYLSERWELVKKSYENFLQHHNELINKLRPDQRKKEQDLATQTEDIYLDTVTAIRIRINEIDAIECAARVSGQNRAGPNTPPVINSPNRSDRSADYVTGDRAVSPNEARRGTDRNMSRFAIPQSRMNEEREQLMSADLRHRIEQNRTRLELTRFQLEELRLDNRWVRGEEGTTQERERESFHASRGTPDRAVSVRSVVVPQNKPHDQRERQHDRQMRETHRARQFGCHLCHQPHPLNKCKHFIEQTVDERLQTVSNLNLCRNCFGKLGDEQHFCNAKRHGPCRRCANGQFHNSLLCYKYY